MNIKELEKRVIELDTQMQAVIEEVGEDLEKLEALKRKDKQYRKLHDVIGHYVYIHYLLNDKKL